MELTDQYIIFMDKSLGYNVYKGLDKINKYDVAIKIFKSYGSTINRNTYCREIEVMKKIQETDCQSYAPKIYDSFITDNTLINSGRPIFVIVQELLYGSTLDEIIYTNKNIDYLYMIASHVLKIVDCLHKNNIVHNDIKSSNFIWNGKLLKIIDFGESSYEGIDAFCEIYNSNINDKYLDIQHTIELIVEIFSNNNFGFTYIKGLYKKGELFTIFDRCTGNKDHIMDLIINIISTSIESLPSSPFYD